MKALFVIAPENFKDEEYFIPKEILEANGIETKTASLTTEATSVAGKTIQTDLTLDQATTDFDAIIFIGGQGASVYFDNQTALELVKHYNNNEKIVAAICIAPSTLANAGILKDKQATSYPSQQENLEAKGATYTGDPVTTDGNIITGKNPDAAEEFGKKIVELLQ